MRGGGEEGRGGGGEEEIWSCCEGEWEETGGQRRYKLRVGRRGKNSGLVGEEGEVRGERGREKVGGNDTYIDFKFTHVCIYGYTHNADTNNPCIVRAVYLCTYRCEAETQYCVVILLHLNMHLASYT